MPSKRTKTSQQQPLSTNNENVVVVPSPSTPLKPSNKKSKNKNVAAVSTSNSFANVIEKPIEQKQDQSTEQLVDSLTNLKLHDQPQTTIDTDINIIVQSAVKCANEKVNNSNFYLYDDIMKYIDPNVIIDKKDQQILLKNVKLLDQNGINLVYVLLKMYYIKHTSSNECINAQSLLDLPYQGKVIKEHNNFIMDIEFDIKKIPNKAQLLLYHFTVRHLKSINILKTF